MWRRFRPVSLVLVYHRFGRVAEDPHGLWVAPERFREHCELLREHYRVLPLCELVQRAREPERGRPRIAITIDDGYVDCSRIAWPILRESGLAATIFVATGLLGSGRAFWWDELIRLVMRHDDELTLTAGGPSRTWPVRSREQRLAAYREIWQELRASSDDRREAALAQLRRSAGEPAAARDEERIMSREELRELAGDERMEIGAHTVTHPRLSGLDLPQQRAEIAGSLDHLGGLLGRRPRAFAYPFGDPESFGPLTVRVVRECGVAVACTNSPRAIAAGTDPLQVGRITVPDLDGASLRSRIDQTLQDADPSPTLPAARSLR